jgi:hypothetical protein
VVDRALNPKSIDRKLLGGNELKIISLVGSPHGLKGNTARPADTAKAMDAFYTRMKTLIQYRKEEWPYEYDYWVKHHDLGR